MKKLFIIVLVCICLVGLANATVPDAPTLKYPLNASVLQDLNVHLMVNVNDLDGDWLNITFYNASDNNLIGWNLVNGSGMAACVWSDLSYGNTYEWYANASDSTDTTQSNAFNFSLAAATPSSQWVDTYIEPSSGFGWSSITNTTQVLEMIINPYTLAMGSWFYAIFTFVMVGLIYIKSQTVFLPSVVLLLCGVTMISILPGEIYGAAIAMIALGFTGIVYMVFHDRL